MIRFLQNKSIIPTIIQLNISSETYYSLHHLLQLSFPDNNATIMPSSETGIVQ